jgi:exodeoxyribonuclease VII large subunit
MDELIEDAGGGNAPEFSVSEISGAIKRAIEGGFSHIRVRGEVGRLSLPRSGHVYLDLKDDRSVLAGVIWKGTAQRLAHPPEEGMEVIATGRLTTFPGQSKYQMVIEDLRPAGAGALMAMLEKRRLALAAEGLFDPARKKPLPFLPAVIGVVTSPSGAVIRDILHRLRDRFPRPVLIWPAAVQGVNCAPEVARAIRGFNALPRDGAIPRPDLIIVARGGGSLEDLWGFNEEIVVRAAAESAIPLISAVGHETDTTLIDHAADWRAPTPTAAAERAVPVRMDLLAGLRGQENRLTRGMTAALGNRKQRLADLSRALPRADSLLDAARQRLDLAAAGLAPALRHRGAQARTRLMGAATRLAPALERAVARKRLAFGQGAARLSPVALRGLTRQGRTDLARLTQRLDPGRTARRLDEAQARLDELTHRLGRVGVTGLASKRERLLALERLLDSLGPAQTLNRGYAVVRSGSTILTRRADAARHSTLEIEFADGRLVVSPSSGPSRSGARSGPAKPGPDQGQLF